MSEHDIMTIKEVSAYLRVSERTVLDWAQKGEIPCGKLGSSWRFKNDAIVEWINQRLTSAPAPIYPKIRLELILQPDCLIIEDGKTSKEQALLALIDKMAESHHINDVSEFRKAIFDREELMSTGIGLGLGIPHVRLKSIADISMGAMLIRGGIEDYETIDGQMVNMVFMICANETQHNDYLKFLSTLSKQLQSDSYRGDLLQAVDTDNFYMKLIRGI
jgi:PTS system nitrogen regulatory IIA component